MTENRNMALSDDLMAAATGGITDPDPYGYVCEGTVLQSAGMSGDGATYRVDCDNGRIYLAVWNYRSELSPGERVQLIHEDDGSYNLEAIME